MTDTAIPADFSTLGIVVLCAGHGAIELRFASGESERWIPADPMTLDDLDALGLDAMVHSGRLYTREPEYFG